MSEIEIGGKGYPYEQQAFALPPVDLLAWLSKRDSFPKVFWKERDGSAAYAAAGSLLSFDAVPDLSRCTVDLRFYGGMRFDTERERDGLWEAFPDKKFWLPRWEIVQKGEQTTLIVRNTPGIELFSYEKMGWEKRRFFERKRACVLRHGKPVLRRC